MLVGSQKSESCPTSRLIQKLARLNNQCGTCTHAEAFEVPTMYVLARTKESPSGEVVQSFRQKMAHPGTEVVCHELHDVVPLGSQCDAHVLDPTKQRLSL